MSKPQKKRYKLDVSEDLKLGVSSYGVDALQNMLLSLGYLRGAYHLGEVCDCTVRAIRRYQRFYKLKVDGIAGPVTCEHLEQVRCGVSDLPLSPDGTSSSAPFVHRGCKYHKNQFTYAFLNGTADLAGNREREIIHQAFTAWENVANLRFEEVLPNDTPDFRIAWHKGNHGDGSPFDGPSNTLAHAFYPPPCGGTHAGDLHFDEAELWAEDPGAGTIRLLQVAIHEIGHLLGLSHSRDESAIMFAFYAPDRTNLADDDIIGIQGLYGAPTTTVQLALGSESSSTLSRAGDEVHYTVEVPETLLVSIDGPADADFDLYIRKNSKPTVDEWDYRAYTVSADEKLRIPAEEGTKFHIMVKSYDGDGDFKIKIEPAD